MCLDRCRCSVARSVNRITNETVTGVAKRQWSDSNELLLEMWFKIYEPNHDPALTLAAFHSDCLAHIYDFWLCHFCL